MTTTITSKQIMRFHRTVLPVCEMVDATESCAICMEPTGDRLKLECGHKYCAGCLLRWLDEASTCPMCRKEIEMWSLSGPYLTCKATVTTEVTSTDEIESSEVLHILYEFPEDVTLRDLIEAGIM